MALKPPRLGIRIRNFIKIFVKQSTFFLAPWFIEVKINFRSNYWREITIYNKVSHRHASLCCAPLWLLWVPVIQILLQIHQICLLRGPFRLVITIVRVLHRTQCKTCKTYTSVQTVMIAWKTTHRVYQVFIITLTAIVCNSM